MVPSRAHSEVLDGGAERRRVVAVVAAGLLASGVLALVTVDGLGASAPSAWTGVPALVGYATTASTGTYGLKVYPSVSGNYQASVVGVLGYSDASSGTSRSRADGGRRLSVGLVGGKQAFNTRVGRPAVGRSV